MPEADKHPGNTSGAKVPVIPAPTRSRANLANQSPGPKTRAAAGHESIKTRPRSGAAPKAGPQPKPAEQGRRRGDEAWIPVNLAERDETENTLSCPAVQRDRPQPRNRRSSVAVAGGVALAIVCAVTGPVARENRASGPHAAMEMQRRPELPRVPAAASSPALPRTELPNDPNAALTTALNDLNTALEGFPRGSPEQILRKVSKRRQDCLLVWTNNLPSLVFGTEPLGPNSLAYTLEDCAEAVSRMH